jgi:hypothetical protein
MPILPPAAINGVPNQESHASDFDMDFAMEY